jgi:PTH1 family peptidyl-tRNA hydrolase
LESDLLVVLDDVALPVGRLRLRAGGSSGGHRGLESVIAHVQTDRVPRLRLGCRSTEEGLEEDLADYVLSRWPKALRPEIDTMVARAADAAEAWLADTIEDVMTRYNC